MQTFYFFYNITLTVFFVICGIGYLITYLKNKEKFFLCITGVFALFPIDNLLFYSGEFLPNIHSAYNNVDYLLPLLTCALAILINFSFRNATLLWRNKKIRQKEMILWLTLFVLDAIITICFDSSLSRLLLWLIVDGSTIIVFTLALLCVVNAEDEFDKACLPKRRVSFFVIALCLAVGSGIENAVASELGISLLGNRMLFSELIVLFCTVFAVFDLVKRLFSEESTNEQKLKIIPVQLISDFDVIGESFSLTTKEKEIAYLLYKNSSYDEITQIVGTSLGTVKAHIHNVYTKMGVQRKKQLIELLEAKYICD